jgi:hypothetical protein
MALLLRQRTSEMQGLLLGGMGGAALIKRAGQ